MKFKNYEEANKYILEQMPDYLTRHCGVKNLNKNFSCLFSGHEDKNPSMSFIANSNTVYCHACGKGANIYTLIAEDNNCSTQEAFKVACDLFDFEIEKYESKADKLTNKEIINIAHKNIKTSEKAIQYLLSRGITQDLIDKYKIGYLEDFKTNINDKFCEIEVVIFPCDEDSFVARNINSNEQSSKIRNRGEHMLFNRNLIHTKNNIIICEGIIDALSFEKIGYEAVSPTGIKTEELLKELKKVENKSELKVFVCLDNDKTGAKRSPEVVSDILQLGIKVLNKTPYGTYKDANEAYLNDTESFKNYVENMISEFDNEFLLEEEKRKEELLKKDEEYLKTNAFNLIDDFLIYINDYENRKPIQTKFKVLDNDLSGGFYSGLYIIGGLSSVGKTTFTLQIADQIASNENNVLIYSLEMSKYELIAKSISRYSVNEFSNNRIFSLDTRQILNNFITLQEQKNAFEKSLEKYKKLAKYEYLIEVPMYQRTFTYIKDSIKANIEKLKSKPIVFIDYLQCMQSKDFKMSDKQHMDNLISNFKQLSRDLDITIVLISSLNRESYNSEATMSAFKESGSIEYGADVLLVLQVHGMKDKNSKESKNFNYTNELNKTERDIELVVLKNRNGRAGTKIQFQYLPKYNYFKESLSLSFEASTERKDI